MLPGRYDKRVRWTAFHRIEAVRDNLQLSALSKCSSQLFGAETFPLYLWMFVQDRTCKFSSKITAYWSFDNPASHSQSVKGAALEIWSISDRNETF